MYHRGQRISLWLKSILLFALAAKLVYTFKLISPSPHWQIVQGMSQIFVNQVIVAHRQSLIIITEIPWTLWILLSWLYLALNTHHSSIIFSSSSFHCHHIIATISLPSFQHHHFIVIISILENRSNISGKYHWANIFSIIIFWQIKVTLHQKSPASLICPPPHAQLPPIQGPLPPSMQGAED